MGRPRARCPAPGCPKAGRQETAPMPRSARRHVPNNPAGQLRLLLPQTSPTCALKQEGHHIAVLLCLHGDHIVVCGALEHLGLRQERNNPVRAPSRGGIDAAAAQIASTAAPRQAHATDPVRRPRQAAARTMLFRFMPMLNERSARKCSKPSERRERATSETWEESMACSVMPPPLTSKLASVISSLTASSTCRWGVEPRQAGDRKATSVRGSVGAGGVAPWLAARDLPSSAGLPAPAVPQTCWRSAGSGFQDLQQEPGKWRVARCCDGEQAVPAVAANGRQQQAAAALRL